ncbi:hypothetical protein D3273_23450 [Lichenibacterium minor]|uniref:Uncharacterized protein n=1 Tax=Lichenibacterium minor TaxID=2316528 RepID=A0A4Q2U444_9HYPH|nr:hypothetical protein [Lichenibacterium minor]RYC29545.1 hypothetical protein D3273_23450 [Lichenibacterium minor]
MNAIVTLPIASFDLAHLTPAAPSPLEVILSASGPAFMGVFAPDGGRPELSTLREGIQRAQAFLDSCAAQTGALRDAAAPLPVEAIGRQIGAFVTAWPNASKADLAGYGAQLAEDVIERRPCRYALQAALRRLRHTSRFLPSIAEVLVAIDGEQSRIRGTLWHVSQIPTELDRARTALAAAKGRAKATRQRDGERSSLGGTA